MLFEGNEYNWVGGAGAEIVDVKKIELIDTKSIPLLPETSNLLSFTEQQYLHSLSSINEISKDTISSIMNNVNQPNIDNYIKNNKFNQTNIYLLTSQIIRENGYDNNYIIYNMINGKIHSKTQLTRIPNLNTHNFVALMASKNKEYPDSEYDIINDYFKLTKYQFNLRQYKHLFCIKTNENIQITVLSNEYICYSLTEIKFPEKIINEYLPMNFTYFKIERFQKDIKNNHNKIFERLPFIQNNLNICSYDGSRNMFIAVILPDINIGHPLIVPFILYSKTFGDHIDISNLKKGISTKLQINDKINLIVHKNNTPNKIENSYKILYDDSNPDLNNYNIVYAFTQSSINDGQWKSYQSYFSDSFITLDEKSCDIDNRSTILDNSHKYNYYISIPYYKNKYKILEKQDTLDDVYTWLYKKMSPDEQITPEIFQENLRNGINNKLCLSTNVPLVKYEINEPIILDKITDNIDLQQSPALSKGIGNLDMSLINPAGHISFGITDRQFQILDKSKLITGYCPISRDHVIASTLIENIILKIDSSGISFLHDPEKKKFDNPAKSGLPFSSTINDSNDQQIRNKLMNYNINHIVPVVGNGLCGFNSLAIWAKICGFYDSEIITHTKYVDDLVEYSCTAFKAYLKNEDVSTVNRNFRYEIKHDISEEKRIHLKTHLGTAFITELLDTSEKEIYNNETKQIETPMKDVLNKMFGNNNWPVRSTMTIERQVNIESIEYGEKMNEMISQALNSGTITGKNISVDGNKWNIQLMMWNFYLVEELLPNINIDSYIDGFELSMKHGNSNMDIEYLKFIVTYIHPFNKATNARLITSKDSISLKMNATAEEEILIKKKS